MMSPESAWKATLGELELQMTKATFNTWLKDARLLQYKNDAYTIGVRNDYAKDWLENRLRDTILRTLSAIVGEKVKLIFEVSSEKKVIQSRSYEPAGAALLHRANGGRSRTTMDQHAANGHGTLTTTASPVYNGDIDLKDEYIFTTFVVGPSNRLAHAAALSVGEKPGQTYNPLFIYGGVGLEKPICSMRLVIAALKATSAFAMSRLRRLQTT